MLKTSTGPSLFQTILLACVMAAIVADAAASPRRERVFDVAREQYTGEKILGPVKIKLTHLNVLRYDLRVGVTVSFTPGPSLDIPVLPPVPAKPKVVTTKVEAQPCPPVPEKEATLNLQFMGLQAAVKCWDGRSAAIKDKVETYVSDLSHARDQTLAFIAGSDALLTTSGAEKLAAQAKEVSKLISPSLDKLWPQSEIDAARAQVESANTRLEELPKNYSNDWDGWYQNNRDALTLLQNLIKSLLDRLDAIDGAGPLGKTFNEVKERLRTWDQLFKSVEKKAFEHTLDMDCGFTFFENKESKVELVKQDRLADPPAKPVREEVVTVVCQGPLSISTGFGISSVDEENIALVASTKTVTDPMTGATSVANVSRFGFTSRSSFQPVPLLLVNTRLAPLSDALSLHLSAGAAVDISTGQTGTDLELIAGGSLSFHRSTFLTVAYHAGRKPLLAGGFKIGDEVPQGVSQPPIENTWGHGVLVSLSYRLR